MDVDHGGILVPMGTVPRERVLASNCTITYLGMQRLNGASALSIFTLPRTPAKRRQYDDR
jgi:hypothetical protein